MKRIVPFFLILFSLFLSGISAGAYTLDDKQLALDQFRDCAFQPEYGENARDYTVRWEKPIHVYLGGDCLDADIAYFYRLISHLSDTVSGLPEIRITPNLYDANMLIYFSPISDMGLYASNYIEGNWGFFSFWNDAGQITNAEIAIASDVTTQEERYHLITEEFVGALGLANDHYLDYSSILYADQNETYVLTEADRLMIEFLYNPVIPSGLTWHEIEPIIQSMY